MFCKILIDLDEYNRLLAVEQAFHLKENNRSPSDQKGLGSEEEAAKELENRTANELTTPIPRIISESETEIELVKKTFRPKARKILAKLSEYENISWDSDGQLTINGVSLDGSDIKILMPKLIYGKRENKVPGEIEFFQFIDQVGLGHLVTSTSPSEKWYYIGDD